MSTLILEHECLVQKLTLTDDSFIMFLNDGRSISVPLTWYPRLLHAERCELEHYEFIGGGEGIHWIDLDEDISVEGILSGRHSGESQKSFEKWLKKRA